MLGGTLALLGACTGQHRLPASEGDAQRFESREAFFAEPLYYIRIRNWDDGKMSPAALGEDTKVDGAVLEVFRVKPSDDHHCPDSVVDEGDLVYRTKKFDVRTSGNLTKGTPKSSFKLGLDKAKSPFGMSALNLKSMWNDVSQMRESMAWELFRAAQVTAPLHTYARFCMNGRYFGLFSVIEQIDKSFLKDRFGLNSKGNLYKAYWKPDDVGPATLGYRRGRDGDDSGRQYFKAKKIDDRSYQLKSNDGDDDNPALQNYDDLARFARVVNGYGLARQDATSFNSPEYEQQVEALFDVNAFLRWAGVNVLLGAWDNYWRTPANYYLYNAGVAGEPANFMAQPYFVWLPWDYDNSFGISYTTQRWQYADLLNWEGNSADKTNIPLVRNLLKNKKYRLYYLNFLRNFLQTQFTPEWAQTRVESLWKRIERSVYLESDSPQGVPHTARQFTNDQVYYNGYKQYEFDLPGSGKMEGIVNYVRMRRDSALKQLENLEH